MITDQIFTYPLRKLDNMCTKALKERARNWKIEGVDLEKSNKTELIRKISEFMDKNNIKSDILARVKIYNIQGGPFWVEKLWFNPITISSCYLSTSFCKTSSHGYAEYYTANYPGTEEWLTYFPEKDVWQCDERVRSQTKGVYMVQSLPILNNYNQLRNVVSLLEIRWTYLSILLVLRDLVPRDIIDYTINLYVNQSLSQITIFYQP